MREPYVHCASLIISDEQAQAPGAAVTTALCGHWEHDPPCPLAPHHTSTQRRGDVLDVRVVFVAEPGREAEVRGRIVAALATAPPEDIGPTPRWIMVSAAAGTLTAAEAALAARWETS